VGLDRAIELAESLELSPQTDVDPSSLMSLGFEDANEAFAFNLRFRGSCFNTKTWTSDGCTFVNMPVEYERQVLSWLTDNCESQWMPFEWVRVWFWTDEDQHRFEAAL
jgi:hypothetical protein